MAHSPKRAREAIFRICCHCRLGAVRYDILDRLLLKDRCRQRLGVGHGIDDIGSSEAVNDRSKHTGEVYGM
eukprot:scaffold1506_cov179-Amphora_coffeaeformis.AAC.12